MKNIVYIALSGILFFSCTKKDMLHDASGTFEATEIMVSSEISGQLESFSVQEGDNLKAGQVVGKIDSTQYYLEKQRVQTASKGKEVNKPDVALQIASTKEQLAKAEFEKKRIQRLLADNAATQKQLDDVNSQIEVIKKQLKAQISQLSNSVNALTEESKTYQIQAHQVQDKLNKCKIINPIDGTVLAKYTEEKELIMQGKPMYKIADTKNMFLRAYVIATQIEKIKIGQKVTVYINTSEGNQKKITGTITWISSKAEFTPKTIQTQDERQNLVYAVKISVPNPNGEIKIGMYGDVDF